MLSPRTALCDMIPMISKPGSRPVKTDERTSWPTRLTESDRSPQGQDAHQASARAARFTKNLFRSKAQGARPAQRAGSPSTHDTFLVGFSFYSLTTSASRSVALSAAISALV